MVGILITGHGKFSTGLYESLKMVFGVESNIRQEDFLQSDTAEDLKVRLEKVIDELLETNDGVVCLTDIQGGTPYRSCAEISLAKPGKLCVISGTNMPMLISIAAERADVNLEEASAICLESGKDEIATFVLKTKTVDEDLEEDGI